MRADTHTYTHALIHARAITCMPCADVQITMNPPCTSVQATKRVIVGVTVKYEGFGKGSCVCVCVCVRVCVRARARARVCVCRFVTPLVFIMMSLRLLHTNIGTLTNTYLVHLQTHICSVRPSVRPSVCPSACLLPFGRLTDREVRARVQV